MPTNVATDPQGASATVIPLVSVIMPCFNAGRMLKPALDSVLRQTWPNLEIIFVDNNSTDGSLALAREVAAGCGRPMRVEICPEQGVNHARNLGFTHARGDFIQWLDADDELAPGKIALQIAALAADPASDIAYGDWMEVRSSPGRPDLGRQHLLTQVDDQIARTLAVIWYPPHLYLLRRAAAERLQAVQAWHPERPVATDVEYSAIAALLGFRFRHVPGAKVRYNIWSDGQIGSGTPYSVRVATLFAIFRRLQAVAIEAGASLTPRHRILLNQGWDIWRAPPGSVAVEKLAGGRLRLRSEAGMVEARPRHAAAIRALMEAPAALASFHLALMLADTVPEIGGDHVMAMQILQRFQEQGLMVRVEEPTPDASPDADG
jgi:hypothetical protein